MAREPIQHPVPGQNPPRPAPYMPGYQVDIAQQQTSFVDTAPQPSLSVVSVFDARPINGRDFVTYTGTNPSDVVATTVAPQDTVSIFYVVPQGYTAIVREFNINAICHYADGGPVINPDGTSNFQARIDFLINGAYVFPVTSLLTFELPYGSQNNKVYIVASAGDIIEMRVTAIDTESDAEFIGLYATLYGNLLLSQGLQPEFEPGTKVPLPVVGG